MKSEQTLPAEQTDFNDLGWLNPDDSTAKYAAQARQFKMNPDVMRRGMSRIHGVLTRLGFDRMRQGQAEAILSLLSLKDTYCVLPTGGGKSAIYIVPTLCMDWKTLIFSPLVSLMQDQANKLQRFQLAGMAVSSSQLGSDNSRALMNWESNDLQFMLAAPERMENNIFMETMRKSPPDMIVIDEAHCISQWGDSFRTSYLKIGSFIDQLKPKVVLSLTATATADVETDIRRVLGLQQARRVIYYPKRTNLHHRTVFGYSDEKLLMHIENTKGQIIVYCATRKMCDSLFASIGKDITGSALTYHGGMTSDERKDNQAVFMRNEARVMFATNAFGLGVDKPDIRGVFHRDVPGSLEALVQEQGRAGRDGLDSKCIMFWTEKSLETAKWLIETSYPDKYLIERVFHAIKKLAGVDGEIQVTLDDVSGSLGINPKIVGSAIGILTASKVLERSKEDQNPMKIKLLKDHPDPQFQAIMDAAKHGVLQANGYYEINQTAFSAQTGLKSTTLMTKLRQLAKDQYVEYTLPFRGKTTKVIGDVSLVPFERIKQRRESQLDKLDVVRDFIHVTDSGKHDYLQGYFGVEDHQT